MADSKAPPYALVLLPPPPSPLSLPALKAAYGPTLSSILPTLSDQVKGSQEIARLDIALSWYSRAGRDLPRSALFHQTQNLLSTVYQLIYTVSVRVGVALDGPRGVDARVFLLDRPLTPGFDALSVISIRTIQGPLLDLRTLALSERPWSTVFAVETEQGKALLRDFLKLYDSQPVVRVRPPIQRVIGGVGMVAPNQPPLSPLSLPETSTRHHSVIVGGTFDHLHVGHKLLLTALALAVEPDDDSDPTSQRLVTVGITGEEVLTKKEHAEALESWDDRQKKVADFLESIMIFSSADKVSRSIQRVSRPGPNETFVRVMLGQRLTLNYVQILDPYGPTITDKAITALVISKETRAGGQAVNDRREEKGWPALEVLEVDVLDSTELDENGGELGDKTFGSKISSTEIRRRRMEEANVDI